MRRFEPATNRVRRLRFSFYHPYFSGAQRPDGQWI